MKHVSMVPWDYPGVCVPTRLRDFASNFRTPESRIYTKYVYGQIVRLIKETPLYNYIIMVSPWSYPLQTSNNTLVSVLSPTITMTCQWMQGFSNWGPRSLGSAKQF